MKPFHATRAFTLVELLVVVGIISTLAILILPVARLLMNQAQTSKTISNLRQLQTANQAYAAENGGTYVPVRIGLSGGWNNSGDNTENDRRWMKNLAFVQYIGVQEQTVETWAPVAKTGSRVQVRRGSEIYSDGRFTVGWNKTDLLFNPGGLGTGTRWSFRATEIKQPNKLIAFAECNDWMVTHGKVGRWRPEYDTGVSNPDPDAPAFRSRGKLLVVTFSGSVQALTVEEAADFARWSVRAPENN